MLLGTSHVAEVSSFEGTKSTNVIFLLVLGLLLMSITVRGDSGVKKRGNEQ